MDLSICLYCEKHLPEENMSFCSRLCENSEATKPMYSNYYSSRLLNSRTTTNSLNEVHRRLSFSSSTSTSSSISLDNVPKHLNLSSSYLLTNSSILLYQRIPDPKNNQQNVYSNHFFT